jgi:TonB family protein
MSKKDGRTRVLFICIGNACRSPMAEAIARLDAPDAIEAFSAGLAPLGFVVGLTKQTLMRNGYGVEGLESKGISPEVWEQADIIINMSGRPREQAFREYSKVEDWEIEDPFGGDPDIYQQVFEKIRLRVADLTQECRREIAAARSAERRACARLYPTLPIFINLNGANVGIALNIGEDGLALSQAMNLPDGPLHNMRIQFPGAQPWIEVSGQIAWKSKSNKEAGVRFDGLTEEAGQQIRNWISSQVFAGNFKEQKDRICDERSPGMGIPNAPQPGNTIPGSSTSGELIKEHGEASHFSPTAAPTLRRPGLPVSAPKPFARIGKRSDQKPPQSRSKILRDQRYPRVLRLRWGAFAPLLRLGTFATLGVLIGVVSLLLEWMTMRRDVRSEMSAAATQQAEVSSETVQGATPRPITRIPSAPNPSGEKMDLQPRSVEPLLAAEQKSIPNTSLKNPDQQVRAVEPPTANTIPSAPNASKEKMDLRPHSVEPLLAAEQKSIPNTPPKNPDQQVRAMERPTPNTALKTPSRPVESVLARGQATKEPSRAAASVNSLPVEKVQPQPAGSLPATQPQLATPIAPPVILASNSPTADLKEIESSMPPAKLPVIPVKITGAVAIHADPYPSLRIPDGGISKKQRQATSLQLGHVLSRVEPIYPEEAKQQGVQGTVKLHAIIGRQGSVENLESVDGSPVLVAAAMNAVRQWRYTETLLAGQSVETEEDIAITFRLSNPTPPAN